ncbi:hypothetical protein MTO96_030968 [Rhipicephalus appendiculatus]
MREKVLRQLLPGDGTIRCMPRPSHCGERDHDDIAAEAVHQAAPCLACKLREAVETSPERACVYISRVTVSAVFDQSRVQVHPV